MALCYYVKSVHPDWVPSLNHDVIDKVEPVRHFGGISNLGVLLSAPSESELLRKWAEAAPVADSTMKTSVAADAVPALRILRERLSKMNGIYEVEENEQNTYKRVSDLRYDQITALKKKRDDTDTVRAAIVTDRDSPASTNLRYDMRALKAEAVRTIGSGECIGIYNRHYHFIADYNTDTPYLDSVCSFKVDQQFIDVDTMVFGNPLAVINDKHGTNRQPNCQLKFYWQRIGARVEPIIVFIAIKTIRAGEELLCCYGTNYWNSWSKRALGRGIAYASLLPPQNNETLLQDMYEREDAIEWVRFDDDGDVAMENEEKNSSMLKHLAIDNVRMRNACAEMSSEIVRLKAELSALKMRQQERECAKALFELGQSCSS